jgi:cysteine desulfuration protein SufE
MTAGPATARATPTLPARVGILTAELAARHPATARLAWLVERARQRPSLPPEQRTDARLLPGCLSRLWLFAEIEDGRCRFACDSDSQVVRAVAGVLCELADGLPPDELAGADPALPARLGLDALLTPNRRAPRHLTHAAPVRCSQSPSG